MTSSPIRSRLRTRSSPPPPPTTAADRGSKRKRKIEADADDDGGANSDSDVVEISSSELSDYEDVSHDSDDGDDYEAYASRSIRRSSLTRTVGSRQPMPDEIAALRAVVGSLSVGTCQSLIRAANFDIQRAADNYFQQLDDPTASASGAIHATEIESPTSVSSPSSSSNSLPWFTSSSLFGFSQSLSDRRSRGRPARPSSALSQAGRLDRRKSKEVWKKLQVIAKANEKKKKKKNGTKGKKGKKAAGDVSDSDTPMSAANDADLEAHQRLGHYYAGMEVDANIAGKWFPAIVIDVHYSSNLVQVNHPDWPEECEQFIDPTTNRVCNRGEKASLYYQFDQPTTYRTAPLKLPLPGQELYDWPGLGSNNNNGDEDDGELDSEATMMLGSLTCEVACDRPPSRPEFFDCLVSIAADSDTDAEHRFSVMKFWLSKQSRFIRVTESIDELQGKKLTVRESARLLDKVQNNDTWRAFEGWMAQGRDPTYICFAKQEGQLDNPKRANIVNELRQWVQDKDLSDDNEKDETSWDSMEDSDDDVDSDDSSALMRTHAFRFMHGASTSLSHRPRVSLSTHARLLCNQSKLKSVKLAEQTEFLASERPLRLYQLTLTFFVVHAAQKSSPDATLLSLLPLNALMKLLFPNDVELQAKISEAEAPPVPTLQPVVKLDKLMELSVRDEQNQPFYYINKQKQQAEEIAVEQEQEEKQSLQRGRARGKKQLVSAKKNNNKLVPQIVRGPSADDEERCEEMSQKCELSVTLRDYQCDTVQFMLEQEESGAHTNMYLWNQLTFHEQELSSLSSSSDSSSSSRMPLFHYSPLLQRFRFKPMPPIKGGWNVDEMGLGKTICTLSVINFHRPQHEPVEEKKSSSRQDSDFEDVDRAEDGEGPDSVDRVDAAGRVYTGATLVVCPVSLVGQWANELKEKSTRPLKVLLFYGGSRPRKLEKLLNYDVVVTSYGVAASELSLGNNRAKKMIEKTPWLYQGKYTPEYRSMLNQLHWHRIILDESHVIRTGNSTMSTAAYQLEGDRRWLLSGTPLNTSLLDLKGQAEFVQMKGLIGQFWTDVDNLLVQNRTYSDRVRDARGRRSMLGKSRLINTFATIVTKSMTRHEKKQTFNGRAALIMLPPKMVETVLIEPNDSERRAMNEMFAHAKARFEDYKSIGVAVRRSVEVMQLLQPLRIACSGGTVDMTIHRQRMKAELERDAVRTVIERYREKDSLTAESVERAPHRAISDINSECTICLDLMENPMQTKCRHLFCGECIRNLLLAAKGAQKGTGNCPLCRAELSIDQLYSPNIAGGDEEKIEDEEEDQAKAAGTQPKTKKRRIDKQQKRAVQDSDDDSDNPDDAATATGTNGEASDVVTFSSKLNKLFAGLDAMRRDSPSHKALIFTQYLSTMALLKQELSNRSLPFQTLEGHMTMTQRKKNLDSFRNDPECNIFLLSMRAGAVGLTLTAASHVFILEPAVNPAMEQQAIGRIHRLGNTHPRVVVKYLVMRGSIEQTLMAINAEKVANSQRATEAQAPVMDEDDDESAGGRGRKGHRANVNRDLSGTSASTATVGSLHTDVATFRLSELEKLFEAPAINNSTGTNSNFSGAEGRDEVSHSP